MIFPSFLFIVGVAITLSFASRIERGASRMKLAWHVVQRSAGLLLLGLAVNGFPNYDWSSLRVAGILQRIALCYLCSGLFFLYVSAGNAEDESTRARRKVALIAGAAVGVLALYWGLLKCVPVPGMGAGRLDTFGNLPAYIDRTLLGTKHMWTYGITPGVGVTYDPEGLLSTLPVVSATLLGILAGEWMRTRYSGRRKALILALAGIGLVCAGWLLSPLLPLNKRIWTSTFALFSGGVSVILFSVLFAVVDLWRSRWWTPPAMVLGTNAILGFVLSGVITTLSDRFHVTGQDGVRLSLHKWGYQHVFATWLSPVNASLGYAIFIVLLNVLLILPLYRKRIFLRI